MAALYLYREATCWHPPCQGRFERYLFYRAQSCSSWVQGNLVINPGPRVIRMPLQIAAKKGSPMVHIPAPYLITGSNLVQFEWDSVNRVETTMLNWDIPSQYRFEKIDLSAQMNGKINNLFQQTYLSPRPASPTLQLPTQGIGNWCYPLVQPVIDDAGLRQLAGGNNEINLISIFLGRLLVIPILTIWCLLPQRDNYPKSATIP